MSQFPMVARKQAMQAQMQNPMASQAPAVGPELPMVQQKQMQQAMPPQAAPMPAGPMQRRMESLDSDPLKQLYDGLHASQEIKDPHQRMQFQEPIMNAISAAKSGGQG